MTSGTLGKYLSYLGGRPVVRLITVQLGVWNLTYRDSPKSLFPGLPSRDGIDGLIGPLPALTAFLKEVYGIAPWHLFGTLIELGWSSLESGLSLYVTGNLLNMVCCRPSPRIWLPFAMYTPIFRNRLCRECKARI